MAWCDRSIYLNEKNNSFFFSSDGMTLALGTTNGKILIYDLRLNFFVWNI